MPNATIIYIVDDDPDDRAFLIEAIKEIDSSVECYTAVNGQEGLQRLETAAVPIPSLIILDLNMPRIDGRKFLTVIKQHPEFSKIPLIIYSTSFNEMEKEELMHLGAADYVVKQSDFTLIKEKLSAVISSIE